MNKLLVGLLAATAILLVGLNSRAHDDFEAFKAQYGREYQGAEDAYRRAVFMTNFRKIQEHNSNPKKSFTMGVNQFADVTDQEFVENYLGDKTGRAKHQVDDQITVGDVDWRDGGITSIKNQGQCGSCWAFAATAAHESYQILTRGEDNTIALSPQQLVDCSNISPYENAGCNGGYGFHGLEYIKDFGQTTEQQYPYKAVTNNCSMRRGEFTFTAAVEVTGCANMQNALVNRPLAVRVDASNWKLYISGIFDNCVAELNHAVLLVGSTKSYWVIKNSWGPNWGEKGFIRLAKGNTCGVCTGPSYPM